MVSGSVALLLQAYPTLTPDQVKYALTSTADPVTNAPVTAAGAGTINLSRAFDTASHLTNTDNTAATLRAAAVQSYPVANGQGSIDAARGDSVIVDADGNDLTGEVDAQGNTWNAAAWWQASSTLSAWSGGQWLGATWTGDSWQPGDLSSAAGPPPAGPRPAGPRPAGATRTGPRLAGPPARWSSARWSSARWSSADWYRPRLSSLDRIRSRDETVGAPVDARASSRIRCPPEVRWCAVNPASHSSTDNSGR